MGFSITPSRLSRPRRHVGHWGEKNIPSSLSWINVISEGRIFYYVPGLSSFPYTQSWRWHWFTFRLKFCQTFSHWFFTRGHILYIYIKTHRPLGAHGHSNHPGYFCLCSRVISHDRTHPFKSHWPKTKASMYMVADTYSTQTANQISSKSCSSSLCLAKVVYKMGNNWEYMPTQLY